MWAIENSMPNSFRAILNSDYCMVFLTLLMLWLCTTSISTLQKQTAGADSELDAIAELEAVDLEDQMDTSAAGEGTENAFLNPDSNSQSNDASQGNAADKHSLATIFVYPGYCILE